ncbi:MAG: response regulator [Planctomycetes bacterium]|nr:response regulator [Planctomycetota bacterium]
MAKILVIEDNEMNRRMVTRRLTKRGYQVITAVDGLAGIEATRTDRPDLILMDLSLPGIDGWETTRRLKANGESRGIPVIALTAHAMAGDRESAVAAGADDYETKPIDLPRLLAKMAALLPRAGKAVPAAAAGGESAAGESAAEA